MSPNFWTKLANYSHSGAKMIEVYCLCLCSVFTLNFRVSVSVRNWYGPAGCPRSFFPIHSGQEKSFLIWYENMEKPKVGPYLRKTCYFLRMQLIEKPVVAHAPSSLFSVVKIDVS